MKRTYSTDRPRIKRLQGVILFPHDIQEAKKKHENGDEYTEYSYILLRIPDTGQTISTYEEFKLRNYRALRRAFYPSIEEQMDLQYHGNWEAVINSVKETFPKP
jgi:hypothetical protein